MKTRPTKIGVITVLTSPQPSLATLVNPQRKSPKPTIDKINEGTSRVIFLFGMTSLIKNGDKRNEINKIIKGNTKIARQDKLCPKRMTSCFNSHPAKVGPIAGPRPTTNPLRNCKKLS